MSKTNTRTISEVEAMQRSTSFWPGGVIFHTPKGIRIVNTERLELPNLLVELTGFGIRITFTSHPNKPFVLIQSIEQITDLRGFFIDAEKIYEAYRDA